MLRILSIIAATLFAAHGGIAEAQGYHRGGLRPFGFGIGVGYGGTAGFAYPGAYPYYGYGYFPDAYRTGNFEAPDLLDDPYFRAQHKFDSHFPGRYSRRPPLVLRHSVPMPSYQHPSGPSACRHR